ncbi:carbon-nitrogen hydrolase family protein [Qipengyuania sp. 1NDW9]|uniref:carbon-nitrogen hydrolase family protein n=1 Tax=Qipengyuania xiapuensis TaxID=2867236 RepID=UPI001C88C78F|nr:carbon-nitrogen hydrolase family protein [Qipengyuania xiapuensis]MBX7493149.1 carbon-nitrogen hydrolase family protein [Qipengyuania xiapuensis]
MPRIAVLQMQSGIDPEANFETIRDAAREAGAGGAQVLFTPEMSLLLDRNRKRAAPLVKAAAREFPDRLAALATEAGIDLAIGSMAVAHCGGKWANRAYYFKQGASDAAATYDKMHMFDVDLESGESWRESNAYEPGEEVVAVEDTPVGRLGLSICYDMRFPALFEKLGNLRCDTIAVPAAFTVPTGRAHWHVLLRARAIEASAFLVAAAQVGTHEDGRETYGHSLVIDPWGEIILDMGGDGPSLGFADIDLSRIEDVRRQVPSLANRREIAK